MSCKRTTDWSAIRPLTWRALGTGGGNNSQQQSASEQELADCRRKLAELEHKYQADMGRAQQVNFDAGLQQGREEAGTAVRDASEKLAATLTELASQKRRLRLDAEREVVRLSIAIARRILNRELTIDPESLEGVVHAALAKLQNREKWQVRVSPRAVEITTNSVHQAGLGANVIVNADPALQAGDLLIDTPSGELDASVSTQLQEIERGFAERLGLR